MVCFVILINLLCISSVEGQGVDHHGNFFMLAFMETHSNQSKNKIVITAQQSADVEVNIPFLDHVIHHHFDGVSAYHVDLGYSTSVTSVEIAETKAISVVSSSPVSVYGLSVDYGSSDGYLAIPVKALSTYYNVFTYYDGRGSLGQFAVIGIEHDTTVSVDFRGRCRPKSLISISSSTKIYTINAYQVLRIACDEDITGISISSDKPIAVITGHVCTSVQGDGCDHLLEMVIPKNSYGLQYVLYPSKVSGTSFFRVVCDCETLGCPLLTLSSNIWPDPSCNSNGFVDIEVSRRVCLSSTKPVMVVEIMRSAPNQTTLGDPYMSTVPAVDRFTSSYTVSNDIESSGRRFNTYIAIVGAEATMAALPFVVNFSLISNCNYGTASSQVSMDLVNVVYPSALSFGMMTYGLLAGESYGYPAGMRFEDFSGTNECNSVTCFKDGICLEIGSSYRCYCKQAYTGEHCETALVATTNLDSTDSADSSTETINEDATTESMDSSDSSIEMADTTDIAETSTNMGVLYLDKITESDNQLNMSDSSLSASLDPEIQVTTNIDLSLLNTSDTSLSDTLDHNIKITTPEVTVPEDLLPTTPRLTNNCACVCFSLNRSTMDTIIEETKILQEQLSVETEILSATVRKRISVSDDRVSASGIGIIGIFVLLFVFGFVVLSDIFSCLTRSKKKTGPIE